MDELDLKVKLEGAALYRAILKSKSANAEDIADWLLRTICEELELGASEEYPASDEVSVKPLSLMKSRS